VTLANWFWLFVVLAVVSWGLGYWRKDYAPYSFWPILIPLAILGWRVFGSVVH
jgi:hypothetical protein